MTARDRQTDTKQFESRMESTVDFEHARNKTTVQNSVIWWRTVWQWQPTCKTGSQDLKYLKVGRIYIFAIGNGF